MVHVIFNTAADYAVEIQNTKQNSAQVNNTTYLNTKKEFIYVLWTKVFNSFL